MTTETTQVGAGESSPAPDGSASFALVKRLSEAMAYHIQEANKIALELHRYAIPKHAHELERQNNRISS